MGLSSRSRALGALILLGFWQDGAPCVLSVLPILLVLRQRPFCRRGLLASAAIAAVAAVWLAQRVAG